MKQVTRTSAMAVLWLLLTTTGYGQVHSQLYTFVLLDRLEYHVEEDHPVSWELTSWYGGDYNRIWLKGEGDSHLGATETEIEGQLLVSRLITSFWELQAGARIDLQQTKSGWRERAFLAVGLEGMTPYWIEAEPVLFMDSRGRVSGRVAVTRDIRVTQRALLEVSTEVNAGVQTVSEYGLGSGVRDIDLGVRLRQEIKREVAPYIGVTWERLIGETAQSAREAGLQTGSVTMVMGVRLWR